MKLAPYPEYKDSGVPWLGKIPAHWELHRGKWLFQKMERPVRPQDEVVTCFRDGTVTLRKLRRTRGFTESLKEIGYQGIRKGDLVIHQMDAFAGAVGVSDSDGKGTPVYSVCLPKRDLDTHYYAQLVREMSRSEFITSLAKGIRERSTDFRFDTFASLMLPVPLPDEQKKIARFMRNESAHINKFIRNKRRLIELLKEQKQNIINQAVTRGIDPDVKLKPSGVEWIGDIPEHWEVIKLRNLLKPVSSRNRPDLPLLSVVREKGVIVRDVDDLEENHNFIPDDLSNYKVVLKGQFAMNKMKAWQGSYGVSDFDGIVSPAYFVFKLLGKAEPEFFHLAIRSKAYIPFFAKASDGVRIGQWDLSIPRMKEISFFIPSVSEQNEIVNFVSVQHLTIDQAIARAEREIELMREYRTRLISDVVTGQVDVRGVEVLEIAGDDSAEVDESAEDADGFEEAEMSELEEEIEE